MSVGNLPGRRQKALYIVRNGVVTPLAYFRSDLAAAEFLAWQPHVTVPERSVAHRVERNDKGVRR